MTEHQPRPGQVAGAAPDPTPPPGPPLNLFQKVVFELLMAALWTARRLPDKPLYRTAFVVGAGLAGCGGFVASSTVC